MSPVQLAGTLLIAGAICFWLGAGLPPRRVYVETDPQERARLIINHRSNWVVGHILLLAGVLIVAIGLGVFTGTVETANARPLAIVGLVAIALGSIVWAYIVVRFRLAMPPEEYVRTTAEAWTYPTFTLLTLVALILFGIVLLMSGFPIWLGIVIAGLSGLILIAFLARQNTIPALYYIAPLIMGIVLLS
jgi:hypothetical protein